MSDDKAHDAILERAIQIEYDLLKDHEYAPRLALESVCSDSVERYEAAGNDYIMALRFWCFEAAKVRAGA